MKYHYTYLIIKYFIAHNIIAIRDCYCRWFYHSTKNES